VDPVLSQNQEANLGLHQESLSTVPRQSLRHSALHQIRQAIVTGELKPGSQLNELKLSQQLGISRSLVREILRELEASGTIVSIPYRGVYVREWGSRSVSEVWSLRSRLEEYATELALPRMAEADFRALEKLLDEIRSAACAGDLPELVELDVQFHRRLCRSAGHDLLCKMIEELAGQTRMIIAATMANDEVVPSFREEQVSSHELVLQALRSRDVERARAAIRAHICGVGSVVSDHLRRQEAAAGGAP
jgi:DNA-binding GntR family transcriptional regulator